MPKRPTVGARSALLQESLGRGGCGSCLVNDSGLRGVDRPADDLRSIGRTSRAIATLGGRADAKPPAPCYPASRPSRISRERGALARAARLARARALPTRRIRHAAIMGTIPVVRAIRDLGPPTRGQVAEIVEGRALKGDDLITCVNWRILAGGDGRLLALGDQSDLRCRRQPARQ